MYVLCVPRCFFAHHGCKQWLFFPFDVLWTSALPKILFWLQWQQQKPLTFKTRVTTTKKVLWNEFLHYDSSCATWVSYPSWKFSSQYMGVESHPGALVCSWHFPDRPRCGTATAETYCSKITSQGHCSGVTPPPVSHSSSSLFEKCMTRLCCCISRTVKNYFIFAAHLCM